MRMMGRSSGCSLGGLFKEHDAGGKIEGVVENFGGRTRDAQSCERRRELAQQVLTAEGCKEILGLPHRRYVMAVF